MIMSKLFYIFILLPVIFLGCFQSSNRNLKFQNFYEGNLSQFDSIVSYLDSNQQFLNLFGEVLSSKEINYDLISQLGIDSIYFNSGGCNMKVKQKQYIFTFSEDEFNNIVLSKNRCSGFISHKGAAFKNLENGIKTIGLGWDWFYWEN